MKINFLVTHRKIERKHFRFTFFPLCRGWFFIRRHNHIIVKLIEERAKQANRIKYETMAIGTKQSRIQSKRSTALKLHKCIYSRLFLISHCLFIYIQANSHAVIFFICSDWVVGWVGEEGWSGFISRQHFAKRKLFYSIHCVCWKCSMLSGFTIDVARCVQSIYSNSMMISNASSENKVTAATNNRK